MAKSIISKDKSSMCPPMTGYSLTDDQMRTIGEVSRVLIDAQCYLENDETDNSMECYGDFMTLYTKIHEALTQAYHIMRVHNMTEDAYRMASEHTNHVRELMKKEYGNISGSTQGII